jgi:enoyl-CoA hydratase
MKLGETQMSKVVGSESKDHVAVLTIDRQKTLNALDMETLKALDEAFAAAEADPQVRVVIFTGAGSKAFIAGGDIADLNSRQAGSCLGWNHSRLDGLPPDRVASRRAWWPGT